MPLSCPVAPPSQRELHKDGGGGGSKAALTADRTSSGIGLAPGSPRAAAFRCLPPGGFRLFSYHGKAMRDDEGGAALHECVGGLLHEVLRLGV